MRCTKCGGLMVYQRFPGEDGEHFSGWRCLTCGEIVDKLILKNRAKR